MEHTHHHDPVLNPDLARAQALKYARDLLKSIADVRDSSWSRSVEQALRSAGTAGGNEEAHAFRRMLDEGAALAHAAVRRLERA